MKPHFRFVILFSLTGIVPGFTNHLKAALPEPAVVERGPHYRIWERTVTETLPDGRIVERKSAYTELGTSMHYWKNGQWTESKAQFRLFPGGAVAEEGPFNLIVSPDVSQEPVVDLLTPDSTRFQISPRWLSYYDKVTRQSAMIAAVKPCVGQLVEPNVIVFPDAFDDVAVALRLTYQPWGAEQEVVILESGPLNPADWGLNGDPANIVLEMWSEAHTWPAGGTATASVEGGLDDVKLVFGQAQIGIGKAFSLGNEENSIAVGKTWTKVDGQRQFLIEAVRQTDLAPLLAKLPQQAQANNPAPRAKALAQRKVVADRRGLLAQGAERLKAREKRTQTAAIQPVKTRLGPAVSIDYSIVTTISGMRFKGDTTYYVTNSVTLSGTTTIECGAVIKFTNATNSPANRIVITGPIDCQTSPYRPAIFTGKDDDTVGEVITGSSGDPGANRYAKRALELSVADTAFTLHDLCFRYADKALYPNASGVTLVLSHSKFGNSNFPVYNGAPSVVLRNVLIHDALTAFSTVGSGKTNTAENVTFHRVGTLASDTNNFLTNSLLICVTNGMTYTGANNATNIDDTGIFQTVGAGSRYLVSQSAYRNAGTTNINPDLLAALKLRTTYPPLILTNDIVTDTTLYPQAGRDVDTPDLGYHFDCLDYCWSGLNLSNATLRLSSGVAVAVYGTNGIWLQNGAKFISEGAPTLRNCVVRYQAVQEEPIAWGVTSGTTLSLFRVPSTTTLPELRLRFTDVSLLADTLSECHIVADLTAYILGALELKDSTLRGGFFDVRPTCANPYVLQTIGLTNSLLQRGLYDFTAAYSGDSTPVVMHLRNNLVKDCSLKLNNRTNTTTWTAHDTFFDTVSLTGPDNSYGLLVNTHNGYLSTSTLPNASNTKTVPASDYQIGPLGSTYYPTNGTNLNILIGAGSRNADVAGLYHFTTTTNQVAETNSVVDIGMHFAAVNSSSQSIDTDSDGLANVFEDLDGDGVVDSGETDWNNSTDLGLRVVITRPKNGSNIP